MEEHEKQKLRRFGYAVGTALAGVAAVFVWQGVPRAAAALASLAAYLMLAAAVCPQLLKSVEWAWCGTGRALGWFNTRVILAFTFIFLVAPFGILLRLLGRDPLRLKLEPSRATYLEPRRRKDCPPESFERRF